MRGNQYSLQLQKQSDKGPRGEHVLNWFPVLSSLHPADSLSLNPFRDLLYMTYTATRLFTAPHTSEELQWIGSSSTGDLGTGLTGSSFLSLSTTFFGEEHHQGDVVSAGQERYGNALQALNHALADAAQNCTIDVLKAVMVLTLYEVCSPSDLHPHTAMQSRCWETMHATTPDHQMVELLLIGSNCSFCNRPSLQAGSAIAKGSSVYSPCEDHSLMPNFQTSWSTKPSDRQ